MIRSSNFLENLKKNYTIVIVFLTLSVTILVTSSYNKYLAYEKENYKHGSFNAVDPPIMN